MSFRKIIICLLSTILTCLYTDASERKISFKHLNVEDGLSSMSIYDIWTDTTGIVWLATSVGLDCYDGNTVQSYSPPKEINSQNDKIFTRQLVGDNNGHLYVMYGSYVCILNIHTGVFKTFLSDICNCITYDNGLWIGRRNEILYSSCPEEPAYTYLTLPDGYGEATALHISEDRSLWIGTSVGTILRYHTDNTGTGRLDTVYDKFNSRIYRIYRDSKGTKWIGSFKDGVLTIAHDGSQHTYRHSATDNGTISSDYVRAFCEDNLGNIWIGTYTGLDCLDPKTGNVTRHNPELLRHDAISHSSVWAIRKDNQGTLWVGTYYGGLNFFNPEQNIYNRYPISYAEGKGLSSHIVSKVIVDRSENIWVATEGGGLNMIDRKSGKTTWYNTDSPATRKLTDNNIKDMIYVPSENAIWLGLHFGGVNRIDLNTGKIRYYLKNLASDCSIPSDDVLNVADYGDSLIVRMRTCACIMDKKTGKCRNINPISDIIEQGERLRLFFCDNEKNIWTCLHSAPHLLKLSPPYTGMTVYTSENTKGKLCHGKITGFMQDASGKIWLATSDNGLYLYDRHDNTFTSLGENTVQKGLEHMAESPSSGNIICSYEDGFFIFNPTAQSISRYGKENGFPLRDSHIQSITIRNNSEIFIGGYGGLVSVCEKDLNVVTKPYKLFFTELTVDAEKIMTGSKILPESLIKTTSVTLPADTRSIELFFSSSNHIGANSTTVKYQLEGFDQNWRTVKGERKISYTNLPSGRYRLHVEPASDTVSKICTGACLEIIIQTPWYRSWYAMTIYILLTILIIFISINIYTERVQMREYMKHEKERAEDLKKLEQAKSRFLSNISHEIRTPLTSITTEIEEILHQRNFSPDIYKKVLGIYKNSISLREHIGELMEFHRQDKEPSTPTLPRHKDYMNSDFLEKVTSMVHDNLDNTDFSIDTLIKAVGVSRTVFFRKLKEVSGQTPSDFIMSIRIKKAADMIRLNPEMNIGEISDATGFNTPKYFAKCFKEHYGKSPMAWRKEITENN